MVMVTVMVMVIIILMESGHVNTKSDTTKERKQKCWKANTLASEKQATKQLTKKRKCPKSYISDNEATDSKSGKYIQRNNCIQSGAISPLLRIDVEFGKGSSEEMGGAGW